jgi:hypothetical protein
MRSAASAASVCEATGDPDSTRSVRTEAIISESLGPHASESRSSQSGSVDGSKSDTTWMIARSGVRAATCASVSLWRLKAPTRVVS